jgi:hypothetical protein
VELKASEPRATVTVSLRPYAVISGKVTDVSGLPVGDTQVEMLKKVPGSGPQARGPGAGQYDFLAFGETTTNDRGEFRIRIQPGTYYLVVQRKYPQADWQDHGARATYYPHALDLATAKPIEISLGQQARADVQVIRQPGFRVAGRLLKAGGDQSPPASATFTSIVLVPDPSYTNSPNVVRVYDTDRFEFADVLPGKYLLRAATFAPHGPGVRDWKARLAGGQGIEVTDRDLDGLNVELQPLRDLPGMVTFSEGCDAIPVHIPVIPFGLFPDSRLEVAAGRDGKFVVSGLTPGRYSLDTSNASHVPLSASLGGRDVLRGGFEYPLPEGAELRIVMPCSGGRPQ